MLKIIVNDKIEIIDFGDSISFNGLWFKLVHYTMSESFFIDETNEESLLIVNNKTNEHSLMDLTDAALDRIYKLRYLKHRK